MLGEPGVKQLKKIRSVIQRMARLISDLLQLAHLNQGETAFSPCDLNESLRQAKDDLEARILETRGQITSDPLPTLDADRTQMCQLFQNLLGNALKFHKPNEPPQIRIRSHCPEPGEGQEAFCEMTIEDNGIGFDEKDKERIFGVFQRLDVSRKYEGNGVGLSICQKIVQRHRGTIEVHSAPNEGTRFTIRLPLHQDH